MSQLSTFLKFSSNEAVLDDWEILDDPGHMRAGDLIGILLGLLFFVFPGIIAFWKTITRPRRTGYLCLTNWRMLYYERGDGLFYHHHRTISVNLEDVFGVHCIYERRWTGRESLYMRIHTRNEDGFRIWIQDSGMFLMYLPIVGGLFRHRAMGKDALRLPAVLFEQVQRRRAEQLEPTSRF